MLPQLGIIAFSAYWKAFIQLWVDSSSFLFGLFSCFCSYSFFFFFLFFFFIVVVVVVYNFLLGGGGEVEGLWGESR